MQLEDAKRKATEEYLADQPEKLAAALQKMDRKRKDVAKVRALSSSQPCSRAVAFESMPL